MMPTGREPSSEKRFAISRTAAWRCLAFGALLSACQMAEPDAQFSCLYDECPTGLHCGGNRMCRPTLPGEPADPESDNAAPPMTTTMPPALMPSAAPDAGASPAALPVQHPAPVKLGKEPTQLQSRAFTPHTDVTQVAAEQRTAV
jgi:hypothetical protein